MKRALVTGGSGFIGSHVVDKLLDAGIAPRIYDICASRFHSEPEVETAIGTLDDDSALDDALDGCDSIIHLAAAADVGIVAEHPRDSEDTNARGTIAVLEAARRAGGIHVVYGSTIWVYGESGEGIVDEESPIGLPKHLYTASKLAGEMYCVSYRELYDVPFTILRFGIPYGPRARPAAVIPIFVGKALAGDPLTIAGDGMQTRRFVYVEDLAEGVVRALREPRAADRIYNLTGTETVTIKQLAETVGEIVGDTDIVHTPGRNGDFGGAEISSGRAAAELGWTAATPLREGVRRYVDWFDPEAAPVEAKAPVPASAPKPHRRSLRLPRPRVGTPQIAAISIAMGTLVAWMAASRVADFNSIQIHTVAITTLVAIAGSMTLIWPDPERPARPATTFAWLVAGYLAVLGIPASRHHLGLGAPRPATLVLSAAVALMTFAIALLCRRLIAEPEPAPDRAG